MRFHWLLVGCAAAICVVSAGATARAQQQQPTPHRVTPSRAPVDQAPVKQAEEIVGRVATERNVVLSSEATRALAVEMVRQQAAAPAGAPTENSNAKAQQLLSEVSDQTVGGPISGEQVRQRVRAGKIRQVTATLDQNVATYLVAAGKSISDGARLQLVADLRRQTEGLSASGLPIEAMKSRNLEYMHAVAALVPNQPITDETYAQAHAMLFQRLVKLTIDTTPAGSSVTLDGQDIGPTTIADKPFEPGKSYHFEFTLAGYRTSARDFFVTPAPERQTLAEALEAQETPRSTPDFQPNGGTGAHIGARVSIGIAVAVIVVLVLVVLRQKGGVR